MCRTSQDLDQVIEFLFSIKSGHHLLDIREMKEEKKKKINEREPGTGSGSLIR
jgi:hypothetical protein